MGTTCEYRAPGITDREWLTKELGERNKLLDCATIGSIIYAAVESPRLDGEPGTTVWGLVVITSNDNRDRFNFCHKEVSEDMGPCESDCPARILDLLSDPAPSEYAAKWRERCRANLAKKAAAKTIQPGQVIRFAEPIAFTDGYKGDTFKLMKRPGKRSVTFIPAEGGYTGYRISRWQTRDFAVVE
ncbi:MAG TPA: hypothetical protein VNH18_06445 [Bryobacteraceae bacterium]|nr:hypothetical protein [Bryobacteraceae bacterium]